MLNRLIKRKDDIEEKAREQVRKTYNEERKKFIDKLNDTTPEARALALSVLESLSVDV